MSQLTDDAQQRIRGIVSRSSIYRQMPLTLIESDPDLYVFLVRHPEIVVNMWDLLGVTKVSIQRQGEFTFDAMDGAGTTCQIELVYGDRETHVLYAEGHYEGPLLRRLIRGRCILVLRSSYSETEDRTVQVTSRLDMFVRFDNVGAELIARSLHPLVGKSADHNFVESTRFIGQVSKAAENKSDKLLQFSKRLTKVDDTIRDQFHILTSLTAQRAAERGMARRTEDILTDRR
jgi:hypothetical protein